jgi:hypothetical protein
MSLIFFPNNKATQDRIASIKASFRAAAQWTGDTPVETGMPPALIETPETALDALMPKKAGRSG